MITSTKNWNRQKNHDISNRHCIRQCIRHYSPYKATPLAEGEWNRRPIRVNLTFEGLELTSNPRKRLVPMLHFFPYWMTECYRSKYKKYRVHCCTHVESQAGNNSKKSSTMGPPAGVESLRCGCTAPTTDSLVKKFYSYAACHKINVTTETDNLHLWYWYCILPDIILPLTAHFTQFNTGLPNDVLYSSPFVILRGERASTETAYLDNSSV